MALVPDIKITYQTDGLRVTDQTGRYSLENNAGGWGSPNDDYINVTSATLVITNENTGATKTEDVTAVVTGKNGTTPDEFDFGPFPYMADGIYKVQYTVVTGTGTYTKCISTFFMSDSDCCVDKLIQNIIHNEDDDKYIMRVTKAAALRDSLYKAALSLNSTRVDYFINKLNIICDPCHATA